VNILPVFLLLSIAKGNLIPLGEFISNYIKDKSQVYIIAPELHDVKVANISVTSWKEFLRYMDFNQVEIKESGLYFIFNKKQ
jgi:hypothetical protein